VTRHDVPESIRIISTKEAYMHMIIKTAIASLALAALAGTAGAGCFEGHASLVTADASDEAAVMSTHDNSLRLPQPAADSTEATGAEQVAEPVREAE
jgi:hypothetical protein